MGKEEAGQEDWNVIGVDGDNHGSGLLGVTSSSVLVNIPGLDNGDLLHVVDRYFDDGEELVVVVWEVLGWDRVNCQRYGGWCLGKGKPEIVPNGAGQVEAAGETIKVGGV